MKKMLFLILSFLVIPLAIAQQPVVVMIEEDWQLTVGEPDEEIDAPQVTASMVPFGGAQGLHLQVNLNHALKPEFASGGIQIRVVDDDELLGQIHKRPGEKLSEESEVIRWTATVAQVNSTYLFGISAGTSSSWGTFGGANHYLSFPSSIAPGGLTNYSYQHSLENSGVSYAGNRVQSLRLLRIRRTYSDGQMIEQEVNREVE